MADNSRSKLKNRRRSFFRVLAQVNALILIVSFTLATFVFAINYRSQAKNDFLTNAESKINQNKVLIEYISDTVVNLTRQVFRNQKFNRLISTEFTSEMPKYEARTEAVKILEPQQQAFRYIDSMVFIGDDQFSIGAPVNKFLDVSEEDFSDSILINQAWDSRSEYIWLAPKTHPIYSPDQPVITVLKAFQNFITLENSGVLIINLNPDIFSTAVENFYIGESGFMVIVDENGQLIATPKRAKDLVSNEELNIIIDNALKNSRQYEDENPNLLRNLETTTEDGSYFVSYSKLENTKWYIIALVDSLALTSGTSDLIRMMVAIIAIAVAFSVALSLLFTKRLFKPIIKLSDTMKVYQSGNYGQRIDETFRYEFEILRESYNLMADRISSDFKRISAYSENLEKSKAELNTLNQELEFRVEERNTELIQANEYLEKTLAKNQETQAELIITKHELEDSLIELKDTQSKLVETEKNAALGQLLAGISHEINTPLGTALTSITYLMTMQKDLTNRFEGGQLNRSTFIEFMNDATETTKLITATLHKTIGILDRFKEITILHSERDLSQFSLLERVNDITQLYQERDRRIRYNISIDPATQLHAPSGLIQEILEILIENSITHGFSEGMSNKPTITIQAIVIDRDLEIIYSDNGKGLEKHQESKIFEPFYTTKFGSGGSGLGLHLLYNIVSTTLKGRVDVVAIDGQSLSFKLSLPQLVNDNQEK